MRPAISDWMLKVADVVGQFNCSEKTAKRDLAAHREEGEIDFVGTKRSGHYRLFQDPTTND
jgi:hypothetical protein